MTCCLANRPNCKAFNDFQEQLNEMPVLFPLFCSMEADLGRGQLGLDFKRGLATFLQPLKGTKCFEANSKQKDEGGWNLINLKKCILTIKSSLILKEPYQKPETDELIYQMEAFRRKLFDVRIIGSMTEVIPKENKGINKTYLSITKRKRVLKKNFKKNER